MAVRPAGERIVVGERQEGEPEPLVGDDAVREILAGGLIFAKHPGEGRVGGAAVDQERTDAGRGCGHGEAQGKRALALSGQRRGQENDARLARRVEIDQIRQQAEDRGPEAGPGPAFERLQDQLVEARALRLMADEFADQAALGTQRRDRDQRLEPGRGEELRSGVDAGIETLGAERKSAAGHAAEDKREREDQRLLGRARPLGDRGGRDDARIGHEDVLRLVHLLDAGEEPLVDGAGRLRLTFELAQLDMGLVVGVRLTARGGERRLGIGEALFRRFVFEVDGLGDPLDLRPDEHAQTLALRMGLLERRMRRQQIGA